jgi:hypothetical protein
MDEEVEEKRVSINETRNQENVTEEKNTLFVPIETGRTSSFRSLGQQLEENESSSSGYSDSSDDSQGSFNETAAFQANEAPVTISVASLSKESSNASNMGMRQNQYVEWMITKIEWIIAKYYEKVPYKYECILYVALLSIFCILIAVEIISLNKQIVSNQTDATIILTILLICGFLAVKFNNIVNYRYSTLVCMDKIINFEANSRYIIKTGKNEGKNLVLFVAGKITIYIGFMFILCLLLTELAVKSQPYPSLDGIGSTAVMKMDVTQGHPDLPINIFMTALGVQFGCEHCEGFYDEDSLIIC